MSLPSPTPSPPRRRRLDVLASPSRPVPFTAKLLRRSRSSALPRLPALDAPADSPGSPLSATSPSASPREKKGDAIVLRKAASMPSLVRMPILPEHSYERRGPKWWRSDPGYFVPSHTIFGGYDYMSQRAYVEAEAEAEAEVAWQRRRGVQSKAQGRGAKPGRVTKEGGHGKSRVLASGGGSRVKRSEEQQPMMPG